MRGGGQCTSTAATKGVFFCSSYGSQAYTQHPRTIKMVGSMETASNQKVVVLDGIVISVRGLQFFSPVASRVRFCLGKIGDFSGFVIVCSFEKDRKVQ